MATVAGQAVAKRNRTNQVRLAHSAGGKRARREQERTARPEGGDTVLTGMLADQAALYGVLAEAEALGLELIEVGRLPE